MTFDVDGVRLAADRWPGTGAPVVLLHAGVADRRGWYPVVDHLAALGRPIVAYDRRGFGQTPAAPPSPGRGFRHVDDLYAILDQLGAGPAWLVGSSMGGQVALDATLERPDLVAGLVLVSPAISGAPPPTDLGPTLQPISDAIDAAYEAGNTAEVVRLEARLWLDGPTAPEGRVGGATRELAIAMNTIALTSGAPEDAGESGIEAWPRLAEIRVPTTVAWGDLDVDFVIERSETVAARVPGARAHVIPDTAHLPYLENPTAVATLLHAALRTPPSAAI